MKKNISISSSEYQEKRYEVAKSTMASALTTQNLDFVTDTKARESFIFNCILLADSLLEELGYRENTQSAPKEINSEGTSIRKLSDLLKSQEE